MNEEIKPKPANYAIVHIPEFEQPVILQQSRGWSRAILWTLMLVTTGAVVWANFAKIDESVSATGKLEPSGATKEIQAPTGGVVKEIFVKDGEKVKAGDRLLLFDNTAAQAQLNSLKQIRTSLQQENQFYQSQLSGNTRVNLSDLQVSPQMLDLTKSRANLIAENQVYRTLLNNGDISKLTPAQQEIIASSQIEINARINTSQSEVEQFQRQIAQIETRTKSAQESLKTNQGILNKLSVLANEGGVSQIQFLRQQEEVRNTQSLLNQLSQEKARLQSEIVEGKSRLKNSLAVSRQEWLKEISGNNKRIAEIDSQLTKQIVENNKRIAETSSQISQTAMNLKYQEITAPVNGTVFDLKAHTPGFVASSTEPILKIVPTDKLVAQVYVTNQDIGFVKKDMPVDVRIDSFPFSEFGDIKGKVISIGSDVLPPDQIYPFYRFPVRIELNHQQLKVDGQKIALQSGMGINTNIKIRDRTVMSIFTDMFNSSIESLKNVR